MHIWKGVKNVIAREGLTRVTFENAGEALWEQLVDNLECEAEAGRRRISANRKTRTFDKPLAVADTVDGNYGKEYLECIVLELCDHALKVRWADGSEVYVARCGANVSWKPQSASTS